MDVVYGVHDLVNPLPAIIAITISNTVRMSALKTLLVSVLFVYLVSTASTLAYPLVDYMLTVTRANKIINTKSLLETAMRVGFAVVPPALAASFKNDIIKQVKRRERSRNAPFAPAILDTAEKIIFISFVNVLVAVFGMVLRGAVLGVIKTAVACCLCGYYLMEPRWLMDGLSFRQMFTIVESRWLYLCVIGSGPIIIERICNAIFHGNQSQVLMVVAVWQVFAGYNVWRGWRQLRQHQPLYPRLPLFTVQSNVKSLLVRRVQNSQSQSQSKPVKSE